MRVALPIDEDKGLDSIISNVFARANKFIIIDLIDHDIKDYEIFDNEARTFSHGAGPVAIKILVDKGVDAILAPEIGLGTRELIKEKGLKLYLIKPGKKVSEVIKEVF